MKVQLRAGIRMAGRCAPQLVCCSAACSGRVCFVARGPGAYLLMTE